jgi:hypothetical protein
MRTLTIFLVFALGPATAACAEAIPTELTRAIEQYNHATVANDVAALSSMMTDDYVLVNSDASVQDKTSYLADFGRPGFHIEPYTMEKPINKVHGSTAMTSWLMRLAWIGVEPERGSHLQLIGHVDGDGCSLTERCP